jgi:hypothetical protein
MLIFAQLSERISITKTIHDIYICILRVSESRHFVVSTVLVNVNAVPDLISVLQVLYVNDCAEPPLNNYNNKIDIDVKTS